MPWVRLHATKAYFDMAFLMEKFPDTRATFNFTPSLLLQLEEIGSGSVADLFWEHAARPATDLTPPARPAGFTAVPGEGQVTLTWTANTEPDLAGYVLLRDGVQIATPTGTTYTDRGLVNDRSYAYALVAVDAGGNRSDPATASATPTDLTPSQRTAEARPRYRHADGTQLCPVVGPHGYQPTATYLLSRNSSRPSWPPSRPRPLCLTPPNGAAGSLTRPRLSPTMPASMASLTLRPLARSVV